MAEQLKNMKNAVMGEGGGLQSVSTDVGNTIAENSDVRGGKSKKADEASASLGQFDKSSAGPTHDGTNVGADQQVANQKTGSANHLELNSSE